MKIGLLFLLPRYLFSIGADVMCRLRLIVFLRFLYRTRFILLRKVTIPLTYQGQATVMPEISTLFEVVFKPIILAVGSLAY